MSTKTSSECVNVFLVLKHPDCPGIEGRYMGSNCHKRTCPMMRETKDPPAMT